MWPWREEKKGRSDIKGNYKIVKLTLILRGVKDHEI